MIRSGLRVTRATADAIDIEGRAGREGPLLVATALGAIALTPIIAPGAPTPLRVATFFALAALSAAIGIGAIGRRRRIVIHPERRELVENGRMRALSSARALMLSTAGGETDEEPRIAYRVDLDLGDQPPVTLLEGNDPARVLSDLGQLLPFISLPVQRGWQLPAGATPWRANTAPATEPRAHADLEFVTSPLPSQKRAAIAVLGGAIFTTVAMGVMFATRVRRGGEIALLSWALAICTVTLLYVIGIYVATDRVSVRRRAGRVRIERRALGRVRHAWEIPAADVCRAYAVGPSRNELRHVLIETRNGPHAVPCAGDAALELAGLLSDPQLGSP